MDGRRVALFSVRVILPIVLAVVGAVLIIIGHAKTDLAGAGVVVLGVALMAVLVNVTPDSFSDGGRFLDPAAAIAHAIRSAKNRLTSETTSS